MLPGPYLPGLVSIRPQWTDSSPSTHECVTWWIDTGLTPLTLAQVQGLQAAAESLYLDAWQPMGATTARFHGCIVADYSTAAGFVAPATLTAGVAGSGGAALPNNVAVLMSLKGADRYRGGHGRMYFPCIGQSDLTVDGDHITAGTITAVAAVLNAGPGGAPTVLHDGPGGVGGNNVQQIILRGRALPAPSLPPVSQVVVNALLASQRRRLRKAAHH